MKNDMSGAYILTHVPTGLYYVGSTATLERRMSNHRSELSRGVHRSKKLQDAFTKWEDYERLYFLTDSLEDARNLEQEMLDQRLKEELCCNVGNGSTSTWAKGLPDKYRKIVSKANTGLKRSKATLEKMSRVKLERIAAGKIKIKGDPVVIKGQRYDSIAAAVRATGVSHTALRWRLSSKAAKWEDHYYET